MKDSFGTYHPAVNFIYFCYVIGVSMVFMHPVLLGISATGAFAYSIYLSGRRAAVFNLAGVLPIIILFSIMNPLFNHRGITILFYFRNNPVTLETILYGLTMGLMLGGVIMWFSCYNKVMTSDKFIYLFGRILPSLSLVLSMVLRFVPRFRNQMRMIAEAQAEVPAAKERSTFRSQIAKAKRGLGILSIMTTWALENAIDTADSMNARGYGLRGRTAFTLYRFEKRDIVAILLFGVASAVILYGGMTGTLSMQFFPRLIMNGFSPGAVTGYAVHTVMCFMPLAVDLMEDRKWQQLQSKI